MLVMILKIAAAIGTILTGLLSLIRPRSVFEFTGLKAEGARGMTEIRTILGGVFIALGGLVLYFRQPETYLMLGLTYLFIALVRLISMAVDGSFVKSNLISLVTEILFGIILVLP